MVPATAPASYSILLAHPRTLLREGLAALCESQAPYRVLHQCADGVTALRMIESEKPNIAVLDFGLPDLDALEIIRQLRNAHSPTRFVVLFARDEPKTVIETLRARAHALVLVSDPADCLLKAFESVVAGEVYISPSLEFNTIVRVGGKSAKVHSFDALSTRERQVFTLLVEGIRAKEIGARLGLNPKTIDTYRVNLMRKLDIHSIAGLVKFAIQQNLLSESEGALVSVVVLILKFLETD